MNKITFSIFGLFFSLAALSSSLEQLTIKSIVFTGDFMPGPGRRLPVNPTTIFEVEVYTNGCTQAKDFQVQVEKNQDQQYVSIIRIRRDPCRMISLPISIRLTTDLIEREFYVSVDGQMVALNQVFIKNPLRTIDRTTR